MKNPAVFVLVCALLAFCFGLTQVWFARDSEHFRSANITFMISFSWLVMAGLLTLAMWLL